MGSISTPLSVLPGGGAGAHFSNSGVIEPIKSRAKKEKNLRERLKK